MSEASSMSSLIDPARRPQVLLVSADPELIERVTGALDASIDLEFAVDAREGLERIHLGESDAVVIDMNVEQAWPLVRFTAALDSRVPVVMLDGTGGDVHRDPRQTGASAVLDRDLAVPAMLRVAVARVTGPSAADSLA